MKPIRRRSKTRGGATATCPSEMAPRHHDEAVSSGNLSAKREVVSQVQHDLQEAMLHILLLARWRANAFGRPNPIQLATEFSWSLDVLVWKGVADNLHIKLEI